MIQVPLKGVYNLEPYEIDLTVPAREALKKLPEKMHAEVINNKLYVEDSGSYFHGQTCFKIATRLNEYVTSRKLGDVFMDGVGLYMQDNMVIPDVGFISKKNRHFIEHKGLVGPPDLCIEVLSPGTRKYNFTTKKKLYEKFGVKEYWLVDPATKDAHGFLLKNGKYGDPLILNGKINIRVLKKSVKF